MPKRSEALRLAQKRYLERVKGTEIGERIRRSNIESAKRAFNRRYANDEAFRLEKVKYGIEKYYYDTAEEGSMRAIRKLFGKDLFYGR